MSETFLSLITNLPHLEFEVALTVVQDVVVGLLLWPRIKRAFKRRLDVEHARLDLEHGVTHETPSEIRSEVGNPEAVSLRPWWYDEPYP